MKRLFVKKRLDIIQNLQDFEYIKSLIKTSGFFDIDYYTKENQDVIKAGYDPLDHFVLYGGFEGRNPSKSFDLKRYLRKNVQARESHINPLAYYLIFDKTDLGQLKDETRHTQKKTRKNSKKLVDIINVNFYNSTGEILYKGGAERYVYDLAQLLVRLGYYPRIIQNATVDFEKEYGGIPIIGVHTGETGTNSSAIRGMSRKFSSVCKDADLIIASPLDLACEITDKPVIGINHGIHWDNVQKSLHNNRTSEYMEIFDALDNISVGVCVDTNFINWTRTYDYKFGEKLRYIPNYYDKTVFKSREKDFSGNLSVVYPRRLYDARGIYITLEAFKKVLKRHKDIKLELVGQTDDNLVAMAVKKMIKKFPNQVTLTEYEMDDMHKAYTNSHIILVPTRYSEGTSLSCIEAMATNNAVVATNIGGLPNLIIDSYNGLLIDPNAKALEESVELLISDRSLLKTLAKNAVGVAHAFDKDKWDRRWEQLIKEAL